MKSQTENLIIRLPIVKQDALKSIKRIFLFLLSFVPIFIDSYFPLHYKPYFGSISFITFIAFIIYVNKVPNHVTNGYLEFYRTKIIIAQNGVNELETSNVIVNFIYRGYKGEPTQYIYSLNLLPRDGIGQFKIKQGSATYNGNVLFNKKSEFIIIRNLKDIYTKGNVIAQYSK